MHVTIFYALFCVNFVVSGIIMSCDGEQDDHCFMKKADSATYAWTRMKVSSCHYILLLKSSPSSRKLSPPYYRNKIFLKTIILLISHTFLYTVVDPHLSGPLLSGLFTYP